jgi:nucleotide-binding universal stress UspA family protein
MFKKVLAATARPLECDESVLSASRIAQINNAKLLILHVLESNTSGYQKYIQHYRTGEKIVSNEVYQDQVIEKVYTKYRGDFKPPDKFEFHIAFGVPGMEILKTAREESVDLIILSPHAGKTSSEERQRIGGTVGSTAEAVVKHERCPVMIVNKTIPHGIPHQNKGSYPKIATFLFSQEGLYERQKQDKNPTHSGVRGTTTKGCRIRGVKKPKPAAKKNN